VDFTKGSNSNFFELDGTALKYGANGAEFVINTETNAPTIESEWYIFFGTVEVVLKASEGQGVVSSFVLESDDLDEIDWEWLGGDFTTVESNYFGKGDTTTYDRAIYHPVSNPQLGFHTYTIDWTSDYVKWSIDGAVVRTLTYAEAKSGTRFPQTPMKVKIGNWVGGSSTAPKGTVQWAGGLTDFTKAPFTMYVKSVTITDGTSGAKSYSYGDLSGSWQSIKVEKGDGQFAENSASSSVAASSTVKAESTSTKAASTSTEAATTSAVKSSTTSTLVTKVSTSTQESTTKSTTESTAESTSAAETASSTEGSAASTTSAAPAATSSKPSSAGTYSANFAMLILAFAASYLMI
jgi:beta-glucanase (GH16 family)